LKLYELSAWMRDISTKIYEHAENFAGEIPESLDLLLEQIQASHEEKVHNIVLRRFELRGEIEQAKSEEARIKAIRERLEAEEERWKKYLIDFGNGIKYKWADAQIYYSEKESLDDSMITQEQIEGLPMQYKRIKPPEIDKRALFAALKSGNGEGLPGSIKISKSVVIK
jgi:hypothetical protein